MYISSQSRPEISRLSDQPQRYRSKLYRSFSFDMGPIQYKWTPGGGIESYGWDRFSYFAISLYIWF